MRPTIARLCICALLAMSFVALLAQPLAAFLLDANRITTEAMQ